MKLAFATSVILLVASAGASAGTWCDNFDGVALPLPVFCDDFDRYCPPPNTPCPQDQTYDNYIKNAWPRTSWSFHNHQDQKCGSEMSLSDTQAQLTTTYHGARLVNGGDEGGTLGQSTRFMTTGIQAKFGPQYDQVQGTDAAPLVLEFMMASNINSAASLDISNGYIELALDEHTLTKLEYLDLGYDPEVTPTDYIKVGGNDEMNPGCLSCWGECRNLGATDGRAPHHAWPTICQSYDARTPGSLCPNPAGGDPIPCPPPYCPETPPNKLHKTLAIGALALLDPNPCHCENPVKPNNSHCPRGSDDTYVCGTSGFCSGSSGGTATPCTSNADCYKQMPEYTNHTTTNKHLAFFDGWKWRSLSSAIFDDGRGGGIPGVVGSGDFLLGDKIDGVRLTIKSTTVKIEHWNAQNKGQYVPYAGDPICEPDAKRNDTIAGGITITNPGAGYTSPPAITIAPPSNGRQATATTTITDGLVTGITITDPGKGYSSPPTITIAPPPAGGTQATAAATLGGAAHYEPGLYSWADNIPRKFLGAFNAIRMGSSASCRLCSQDLVNKGGDYANCAPGKWNGTDYECTEFNQLWRAGATWCKRMSGISACYGLNIDDGSNFVTVDTLAVTGGTADASVGACCSSADGSCTVMTEAACAESNGAYAGGGSSCATVSCIGACCRGPNCQETTPQHCDGNFQGPGTTCASAQCPCTADGFLWADSDADGDVDMSDYGRFQECFTGGAPSIPAGCRCFDHVPGDGINDSDFTAFKACADGPNMPYDLANLPPGCTR